MLVCGARGVGNPTAAADPDSYREVGMVEVLIIFEIVVVEVVFKKPELVITGCITMIQIGTNKVGIEQIA